MDWKIRALQFIYHTRFFGIATTRHVEVFEIGNLLNALASQTTKHVLLAQNGIGGKEEEEIAQILNGRKLVLLSGSFNPLHEGRISSIILISEFILFFHLKFLLSLFYLFDHGRC